jgi:hypothetical protein
MQDMLLQHVLRANIKPSTSLRIKGSRLSSATRAFNYPAKQGNTNVINPTPPTSSANVFQYKVRITI